MLYDNWIIHASQLCRYEGIGKFSEHWVALGCTSINFYGSFVLSKLLLALYLIFLYMYLDDVVYSQTLVKSG